MRGNSYVPFMLRRGDGSTLSLDFASMGELDSRFTFSRASTATLINSSGLVQYADHNFFTNTAWLGSTLPTNWFLLFGTGTTTWNADGSVTMTAVTSQRPAINHSAVTVAPGLPHTFGFLATGVSGSPQISQVISSNLTDTYAINGVTVSGTTVVQNNNVVSCTFTPSTTSVTARIGPGSTGSMSSTSLTASRPQFNVGSSLRQYLQNTSTTAPYHAPRFDYDPTTLAARGLLIEAGATNYLPFSQKLVGTGWAPGGICTRTQDYATGPDGVANSATRLEMSYSISEGRIYYQSSYTTLPHTISVWLKSNTGSNQTVRLWNTSGTPVTCTVTPTWQRFQSVSTTGTSLVGYFYLENPSSTVAVDILAWGAQLEAGLGASSYIPTGASTAQRAAESCSMTGANFSSWYGSPTAFSMLLEGIAQVSANYGRILCLSSGANTTSGIPNFNLGLSAATSNRPFINAYILSNNNIDTYAPAGAAVTNGVPFKIGLRHETSSHYITRGASLSAANSYAGFAAGLANLYFGNTDGSTHRSVHYTRVKFWPLALSNAQLDLFAT